MAKVFRKLGTDDEYGAVRPDTDDMFYTELRETTDSMGIETTDSMGVRAKAAA